MRDRGDLLQQVAPEDLIAYGIIPEFIGRVPIIAPLDDLTEDALVEILTQPKNALVTQYAKYFHMEGIELHFTRDALKEIARKAKAYNTGARALRSVMEGFMLEIMFHIPDTEQIKRCTINRDVISQKAPPMYTKKIKRRAQ